MFSRIEDCVGGSASGKNNHISIDWTSPYETYKKKQPRLLRKLFSNKVIYALCIASQAREVEQEYVNFFLTKKNKLLRLKKTKTKKT